MNQDVLSLWQLLNWHTYSKIRDVLITKMLPLLYLKEDEILWIKIYQKDIYLIKMLPNTCTDYGIFLRWTYINFSEQKNLCYILFIALWCVHKKNLHLQISSCRKSLPICVQNKNIWFFKNWIWIYKLRNMCNYVQLYVLYVYDMYHQKN